MATPDTVTPAPKSHKSLPRTTLSYIHMKALRTVPGSGFPGPGNAPVTRRRGTRAGTEGRTGAARTSAGRPTPDSGPDGEGAPPAPDRAGWAAETPPPASPAARPRPGRLPGSAPCPPASPPTPPPAPAIARLPAVGGADPEVGSTIFSRST